MRIPSLAALAIALGAVNALPRDPADPKGGSLCDAGCAPKEVCIQGPDDSVSGQCFRPEYTCGGLRGNLCPDVQNFKCVDDPRASCDPLAKGRDCLGVCVPR